ncbi:MAG: nucleotide exchange factor GrpE, partial [Rhodospirillales bacterium]|nr:nucleotide exchange factor GrpE [Rhodospirillales bacterium]
MPVIDENPLNDPVNDDEEQLDAEGLENEEAAAAALGLDVDVEDDGPFAEDDVDPEARIIELEEETADLKDKLLRALADVENIRRRAERDKSEASKYAITGFARDIVGVADNLRRALDSVDEETRKNSPAVKEAEFEHANPDHFYSDEYANRDVENLIVDMKTYFTLIGKQN